VNFERNVKQKSGRSWDWIVTGHYQHLGQLDDAVLPVCYIHGWNVTRRITANTLRGHVFRPESGSAALEISRHIRWVVSTTEGLQLRGMRAVYGQCWACRRGVRTFRRHIRLHKDRIPRHRHPRRHPHLFPTWRGSRGCRRGCRCRVVECGFYATVCVGETSAARRRERWPVERCASHRLYDRTLALYMQRLSSVKLLMLRCPSFIRGTSVHVSLDAGSLAGSTRCLYRTIV